MRFPRILHQHHIIGGTVILAITQFGASLMGFIRDATFNRVLTPEITDVYFAAFRPSDFLFQTCAGYDIIIVGKPTDRSGFGGAAFASVTMEEEKKEQNTGAVQEPNPFLERHLLVSPYALFDWLIESKNLHRVSFKDLGAGGVVCSSVEQVAALGYGAEIDLDTVHVSLKDLPPEVIACAETQERFCWMCHPDLTKHILKHYNQDWDLPSIAEGARASVIGKVTDGGIYRLRHHGKIVCEAKSTDITSGLQYTRPTAKPDRTRGEPHIRCEGSTVAFASGFTTTIEDIFASMLRHPNYSSVWPVICGYDKTIIGNSQIEAGEADASVITPFRDLESYLPGGTHPDWGDTSALAKIGITFAADGNPRYGRVSAYLQGANAAVEAMCNIAACGALPRALTDCLNYGNPEISGQLGALEEGVRGITDAAKGIAIHGEPMPVISGNVSLYNSTPDGSGIPPSAIVCSIGVIPDAEKTVTMQLKKSGSRLYLLGERKDECGGSAYYEVLEQMAKFESDALLGKNVPVPQYEAIVARIRFLHQACDDGLIAASHDISDGGLLLALFEMTMPKRGLRASIGIDIALDSLGDTRADVLLFSQSQGFVLEVPKKREREFLALAKSFAIQPFALGNTIDEYVLRIGQKKHTILDAQLSALEQIWCGSLEKALAGN